MDPYYDPALKNARLELLKRAAAFLFRHIDIVDRGAVMAAFQEFKPRVVIHLAAQLAYGFRWRIDELGLWPQHATAVSEHQSTEHPLSLYAATKKANEMMAHTYAHLFGIPATGRRHACERVDPRELLQCFRDIWSCPEFVDT